MPRTLIPGAQPYEWLRAYKNSMNLKARVGKCLHVVRYEELVRDPDAIKKIRDFVNNSPNPNILSARHFCSEEARKSSPIPGIHSTREVTGFAQELGYKENEIDTRAHAVWPLYRDATRAAYRSLKLTRPLKRRLRSALR